MFEDKLFEIGAICIVVVAVGYWVTLWLVGRRDDVLHGDYVHPEQGAEATANPVFPASPFPPKPLPPKPLPPKPFPASSSAARSSAARYSSAKPPAGKPAAANLQASPALPDRSDTLQSLLASIKRDLKDAAQL
jgi:hypothetical protein